MNIWPKSLIEKKNLHKLNRLALIAFTRQICCLPDTLCSDDKTLSLVLMLDQSSSHTDSYDTALIRTSPSHTLFRAAVYRRNTHTSYPYLHAALYALLAPLHIQKGGDLEFICLKKGISLICCDRARSRCPPAVNGPNLPFLQYTL
jgi:hypothetical protein